MYLPFFNFEKTRKGCEVLTLSFITTASKFEFCFLSISANVFASSKVSNIPTLLNPAKSNFESTEPPAINISPLDIAPVSPTNPV